jgi:acetyl esterase
MSTETSGEDYIRADVRAFLDDIASRKGRRIHETDAVEARRLSEKMRKLGDIDQRPIATKHDIDIPSPDGHAISARFYDSRKSRAPGPLLIFIHGGGFVLGDLDSYDAACVDIAAGLDLPLLSIGYRLAPENPWPSGADDCEAATRWIAAQGGLFGRSFDSLAIVGDSGGGNLAIVTTMALRDEPAALPVIAIWPLYPATNLRKRYPSTDRLGDDYLLTKNVLRWFNEHYAPDFTHWRASPQLGSQHDMPPVLVSTASLDPLLDQGRAFAAACIDAAVHTVYREARGNVHGWLTLRKGIPSSQEDLQGDLLAFKALIEEYRP